MSQRKEKYLRRALSQYDSIVQDVDQLSMQVPYLDKRMEDTERRLDRRIRNERCQRRSEGQVARWALGVAIVDLIGTALMAVVLL